MFLSDLWKDHEEEDAPIKIEVRLQINFLILTCVIYFASGPSRFNMGTFREGDVFV